MEENRRVVAEKFMRRWNDQVALGIPISSVQEDLAQRLLDLDYPLGIGESDIARAVQRQKDLLKNIAAAVREPGSIGDKGLNIYEYTWRDAGAQIEKAVYDRLTGMPVYHTPEGSKAEITVTDLAWYENYRIVRMIDPGWSNKRLQLFFLYGDDGSLFWLNGTSPPIHEVNARAPIKLDEGNVVSYLRFFCFFVRGEEGPFYCIESLEDEFLKFHIEELKSNRQRDTLIDIIEGTDRGARLREIREDGRFICDGMIFYSNALFIADFAVESTGMIEMMQDDPVAADLPIRMVAPVA